MYIQVRLVNFVAGFVAVSKLSILDIHIQIYFRESCQLFQVFPYDTSMGFWSINMINRHYPCHTVEFYHIKFCHVSFLSYVDPHLIAVMNFSDHGDQASQIGLLVHKLQKIRCKVRSLFCGCLGTTTYNPFW